MRRKLIVILAPIVIIVGLVVINTRSIGLWYTKLASPESVAIFQDEETLITVTYSQPSKNGRKIFGDLVPYGKVWRTGANEATVFETDTDLMISDQNLPKGNYSIYTIPGERDWRIIFNSAIGQWGVRNREGDTSREEDKDVLVVTIPSTNTKEEIEKFNIKLEKSRDTISMILSWDKTSVVVPMAVSI